MKRQARASQDEGGSHDPSLEAPPPVVTDPAALFFRKAAASGLSPACIAVGVGIAESVALLLPQAWLRMATRRVADPTWSRRMGRPALLEAGASRAIRSSASYGALAFTKQCPQLDPVSGYAVATAMSSFAGAALCYPLTRWVHGQCSSRLVRPSPTRAIAHDTLATTANFLVYGAASAGFRSLLSRAGELPDYPAAAASGVLGGAVAVALGHANFCRSLTEHHGGSYGPKLLARTFPYRAAGAALAGLVFESSQEAFRAAGFPENPPVTQEMVARKMAPLEPLFVSLAHQRPTLNPIW